MFLETFNLCEYLFSHKIIIRGQSERLYQFSMLLLAQIYLQWTPVVKLLAKEGNVSLPVNQTQL